MSTAVETKMKRTEVSFTSTFVGLSGYPDSVGSYTSSPTVELEDRFWSIRIYPGGVDQESKGHLSCFVVCESPETTRASFRISVLNQKGWKNHHYVSDSVKQFQNYSSSCVNCWGDPKFITKANLSAPSNGICVDDKIIIRVELTIYGQLEQYIRTPASPHHVGSTLRRKTILDDLSHLLSDTSLADVTIIAPEPTEDPAICSSNGDLQPITETDEDDDAAMDTTTAASASTVMTKLNFDEQPTASTTTTTEKPSCLGSLGMIDTEQTVVRIPAHKFILSLRSPVFRAMFSGDMMEATSNEVLIQDFDSVVMAEFVRFLYTDRCDRSALEQHAEQLLAAACKYQVPGLETLCENHLCSTLSVGNVVNILYLSDLYNAAQLKARALHYIAHNAKEVVQAEGFFQSLSFGLCQEVIRALAGVDAQVNSLDGPHMHTHAPSVLPSPSTDSSPGRPYIP